MFFKSHSFTFNEETSDSYNVCLVDSDSSQNTYDFGLAGTTILEEEIDRKSKPFLLGTKSSPLEFDFSIAKKDSTEFSNAELFDIYSWLMHDTYKILVSDEDTNIKYNVIFTEPKKVKVGQSRYKLMFIARCDNAFGYLIEDEDTYSVSTNQTISIDMTNSNYKKYYTDIEIEFTLGASQSTLTIENTSDDGRIVSFTGLTGGETIYMHNERKELISDITSNRFPEFNLTWFRLVPNVNNTITITGDCNITFKYSLPLLV